MECFSGRRAPLQGYVYVEVSVHESLFPHARLCVAVSFFALFISFKVCTSELVQGAAAPPHSANL